MTRRSGNGTNPELIDAVRAAEALRGRVFRDPVVKGRDLTVEAIVYESAPGARIECRTPSRTIAVRAFEDLVDGEDAAAMDSAIMSAAWREIAQALALLEREGRDDTAPEA